MENIVNLVANYGVSAIVVALFVWDWLTNKKKITETLEEMKVSNSNTSKSLELLQKSMENQEHTLEEIKNKLTTLEFKSENDFALIMDAENGKILYKSKNMNIPDESFLSNYTLSFYSESNGQCFEYYGQTTQACMHKVTIDEGTYYICLLYTSDAADE